jgi:hypothetical protein
MSLELNTETVSELLYADATHLQLRAGRSKDPPATLLTLVADTEEKSGFVGYFTTSSTKAMTRRS